MDCKEKIIIEHYKSLIERREFDEFDILGFLITIRRHLDKERVKGICEIADLIAHRKRNRGIVMDCIDGAIQSQYATGDDDTVIGYHGILPEVWEKEWHTLGSIIGIDFSGQILDEIMLCIFSLVQYSEYQKDDHYGHIVLLHDSDGYLYLATTEGEACSLFICFSKWGTYKIIQSYSAGIIDEPVYTKREYGKLKLMYSNELIVEVK